jgi:hypothetical protein
VWINSTSPSHGGEFNHLASGEENSPMRIRLSRHLLLEDDPGKGRLHSYMSVSGNGHGPLLAIFSAQLGKLREGERFSTSDAKKPVTDFGICG